MENQGCMELGGLVWVYLVKCIEGVLETLFNVHVFNVRV